MTNCSSLQCTAQTTFSTASSPKPKNTQYHLRHRTHGLILPTDVNAASKKNFLYVI